MDPCLVCQIEAGNHARTQKAYMYSDSDNQESARLASMHSAHSVARWRSQSQRQQPSGHVETAPEFGGDTIARRDTAVAIEPAEGMRDKLARISVTSGDLEDDCEESGRASRGEGESFRHECTSSYCAGQPPHEHDSLDEPPFLHPRRGGSSSSYRASDYYSPAYRTEETATSPPTPSSARSSSSSSRPNSTQEQRPGESFRRLCSSSYCAGQPPHEHDRLDEPEFLHRRGDGETFRNQCKSPYCAGEPPHEHDRLDEPGVLHPRRAGESSRWENKSLARPRFEAPRRMAHAQMYPDWDNEEGPVRRPRH